MTQREREKEKDRQRQKIDVWQNYINVSRSAPWKVDIHGNSWQCIDGTSK